MQITHRHTAIIDAQPGAAGGIPLAASTAPRRAADHDVVAVGDFTPRRLATGAIEIDLLGPDALKLGTIRYSANGERMRIHHIEVVKAQRGKGLSHKLMAEALRRHPEVRCIAAMLIDTNYAAFALALQREGFLRRWFHGDQAVAAAARATPAVRARVRLGFDEIVHVRHIAQLKTVELVMQRTAGPA